MANVSGSGLTEDGDLPFYALVELITVIEERFGFEMDAEDITVEVFESVGSLSTSVAEHRS